MLYIPSFIHRETIPERNVQIKCSLVLYSETYFVLRILSSLFCLPFLILGILFSSNRISELKKPWAETEFLLRIRTLFSVYQSSLHVFGNYVSQDQ